MNPLLVKILSCQLLILGLVVCQDGDFAFGSGSGDEIEPMVATVWPKIHKIYTTRKPDDTETDAGSGEDDEDKFVRPKPTTKFVQPDTDEISGSGSGDYRPMTTPSVVEITTKKEKINTLPDTTTMGNKIVNFKPSKPDNPKTKKKSKAATTDNVEIINSPTTTAAPEAEKTTTTMSNFVEEDSIKDPKDNSDTQANDPLPKRPTMPEDPNSLAQKSKGTVPKKSGSGLNFTTGIIIGVVVGAVLAIFVILFLVYRLRKKDEGSYLLDEPGTGYSKQEPGSPTSGKEYFA